MLNKVKEDKSLFQVMMYFVLVIFFMIVNNLNLGGYNISSKIDYMIPFIPIFVIPYFSWFIFIAATGIIFLLKSRDDLRKTFLSINICMVIGILIYIIFPNYQSLRPTTYASDFFSQWVKLLQNGDSPSSVCPSLHVAVSICLYTGVINSVCFKNKPKIKFFTLVLTILICISTMFIKQHSVVDVAYGILLGVFSYIFVYKFYFSEKLFPNHISSPAKANSLDISFSDKTV